MRDVLTIRPELSASRASRLRVFRAVGTTERPEIVISIGPRTEMSIAGGSTRPNIGRTTSPLIRETDTCSFTNLPEFVADALNWRGPSIAPRRMVALCQPEDRLRTPADLPGESATPE